MHMLEANGALLHYKVDGPENGAPLVFANSLGTDLRVWDAVIPYLPAGLRVIRYDKRGHGLSSCPPAPYKMGTLVGDAEQLLDHLGVKDCVFVGLSIGGLIAQGLAAKRLDLMRAMVLSNTAAKIGTRDMWQERIDAVAAKGITALAEPTMERWFSKGFQESPELQMWRNMLTRTPAEGYAACMSAISHTDMMTPTSGLRLPAMGIAGAEDGSTPPDMVRELMGLIPGAGFELIRKAGHLPCVEQPEIYAQHLERFFDSISHGTVAT